MTKKTVISDILFAIITALSFSAFIYLDYFGLHVKLLDTFFGLLALSLFLIISKRAILFSGFLIGLLWFYWIGYSFEYYGHPYMVPVITVLFACIYTLFFAPLALSYNYYIRALFLFGLSFFEPFDFNWLQIEAIFVQSYLGVQKYQLAIILFSLSSFLSFKANKFAYALALLLLLALHVDSEPKELAPLKIKLVTTQIPQELKWKAHMQQRIVQANFTSISKAIKEGYEVVVLPESAFALFLNHHPDLIKRLENLSHKISIITGALYSDNAKNYNVTYIFNEGEYTIANKMVLVPFGEYVPLPEFMRAFVNRVFFDGAEDYTPALKPTDYVIKDVTFRNAICYEVTCEEIYENNPKYIIAMSNNAWFTPSIEPTLQTLLMKYYAKKHHTIIYHSANIEKSVIVN